MKTTELNTDQLVTDLKRVVRDGEELLAATASVAGEKGQEMRERLSGALEAAKATYRRLQQKAVAGAKATDKMIRTHTYQAIGIAFGLGLLIAALARRKKGQPQLPVAARM